MDFSLMFSKELKRCGVWALVTGKLELWRFMIQYTFLEAAKEVLFTFAYKPLPQHGGYFLPYQNLQIDNRVQAFLRNNLQETAFHAT